MLRYIFSTTNNEYDEGFFSLRSSYLLKIEKKRIGFKWKIIKSVIRTNSLYLRDYGSISLFIIFGHIYVKTKLVYFLNQCLTSTLSVSVVLILVSLKSLN